MLLRAAPLLLLAACDPGPAKILLVGIGSDDAKDVHVVPDEPTEVEAKFVNEGGVAQAPTLSFAELACLTIEHDFPGDRVETGAVVVCPLVITATSACDAQTIVDWFVDDEGGSSRGTFNVVLDP